ncbi:MAG: sugar transporter [Ascidiaceihabitans sp.]|uniref:sugar transporter n=1 Tax=Ascidiaceihabitans sp. TaxID=1872644 RepID=UPI0032982400
MRTGNQIAYGWCKSLEDKVNSDTSITGAAQNDADGTAPRKGMRKFQAPQAASRDVAQAPGAEAAEPSVQPAIEEAPDTAKSNEPPQNRPRNRPQNGPQNGPRQKGKGPKAGPGAKGPGAKGKGKGKQNLPPKVVEIAPMATNAGMRRRHWGLVLSALALIVAPLLVSAWYLWAVSTDQYASTVGFTVRQEGGSSSADLLGNGLGDLFGGSSTSDADILYEFIQSQEMVSRIDDRFDLRGHYAQPWPDDVIFAIWPDATIEELVWYWSRIVRVSYDQGSGLIELRVLAFDAKTAQAIGTGIVEESQNMINALNDQARDDLLRYAQRDLEVSLRRLKDAREALILFRTRTQIVDPATDLQGRLGVVNNLQAQLAQALIDLDVLLDQSSENDPRVKQARRTIEVIKNRIVIERENVASGDITVGGEDYPTLLAEFEGLVVDREFAEEGYRAALTALDVARNNAGRQSRYLEAYVRPTLPQSSEFPRRWVLLGMIGLFVGLIWSILALIYYSIRDSR